MKGSSMNKMARIGAVAATVILTGGIVTASAEADAAGSAVPTPGTFTLCADGSYPVRALLPALANTNIPGLFHGATDTAFPGQCVSVALGSLHGIDASIYDLAADGGINVIRLGDVTYNGVTGLTVSAEDGPTFTAA
jgi:hypothetical protein